MEKYRILSDVFAVPGLLCLFLGALRWMAGKGAYRGLGYVVRNAFSLLTLRERKPYRPKETKKTGYAGLFLVGGAFLAIAAMFAGMYFI